MLPTEPWAALAIAALPAWGAAEEEISQVRAFLESKNLGERFCRRIPSLPAGFAEEEPASHLVRPWQQGAPSHLFLFSESYRSQCPGPSGAAIILSSTRLRVLSDLE